MLPYRKTTETFNCMSYIKNLNLKCSFASRAIMVTDKLVRRDKAVGRETGLVCLMCN